MRLLHLEDNPIDSDLIRRLLQAEWGGPCLVDDVKSRESFIRQMAEQPYDAVISDFSLPGWSGLEALVVARQLRPDIPFLFVSGTIGEDMAVDALKRGATDYILKDRMGRLVPALRRALQEANDRRARVDAERNFRELERQYLRSQRLESVGQLAAGIAHDLNNVLAPILLSANVLEQRIKDPEMKNLVSTIGASAQRGAGLVRQVLAFAKGAEGERKETSLGSIVREIAKLIRETFPRSIDLAVEVEDEEKGVRVNVDGTQIGQVILNLAVNARDAIRDEGGKLRLVATSVDVGETLAAANPGAKAGAYGLLTVADNGSGIAPEILDRIFDPFFTTKPAGKGTGLGLATVWRIVKSHGGFVQVQSEMGQGTEFRIYLPAAS